MGSRRTVVGAETTGGMSEQSRQKSAPRAISTRFTRLVGVDFPIMQGGMATVSFAPLVAAVSDAGGLGTLGSAAFFDDPKQLRAEIDAVREQTDRPFAVNIPLFFADLAHVLIDQVVAAGVSIVETAGRSPKPFVERLHDAGLIVVHKAARVRDMVSAAHAGVDALAILGWEAAGHPGPDHVTSLVQARLVHKELVAAGFETPWLLAGGVADGAGLVGALGLGADGVLMGTRFAATREAEGHPACKERYLAAAHTDTLLVMGSIDDDARVLATERAQRLAAAEQAGAPPEELFALYGDHIFRQVVATGDFEQGVLAAGQAVGLVDDLPSARDLVTRMVSEAIDAASRVHLMFA